MNVSNFPSFAKSFYEFKNCAVNTAEDVFALSAKNSAYAKYAVEREHIAYRKYIRKENKLEEWNYSHEIEDISNCVNAAIRSLSNSANISFSDVIEEKPKAIQSLRDVSITQVILAIKEVHARLCDNALSTPEKVLKNYLFGDLDVYRPLKKELFWVSCKNELSYFARYLMKCNYLLALDIIQKAYYEAVDADYPNRILFFKNVEKKISDFAPQFKVATQNLLKQEEIYGYKTHIEQLRSIEKYLDESQDNCNLLANDIMEVIKSPYFCLTSKS